MKFIVSNIQYDTDNKEIDLPTILEIDVPLNEMECYEDIEMFISDSISNKTGFCHTGFNTVPLIENVAKNLDNSK